ncbi:MAG: sulfurtransferase [Elainellaceae cyanobacterium]
MRTNFWHNLVRIRFWRSQLFAFWASLVAVTIAVPLLPFHSFAASPASVTFVSPAWVGEHANDPNLRILDVRTNPLDYISGHVPGAVHIADSTFRGPNGRLPVQYWELSKLESFFKQAGINNDSQVVIYSDEANVLGATMVAYLLERGGLSNIAVLDGGLPGYQEAGQPTAKEFPQYELGNFTLSDDPSVRVSLDEVRQIVSQGNPNVTFIDPRPPELFAGEVDLFIRNGHIPGARNIPWPTFTIGEPNRHQLKPLNEIQAILDQKGITPDRNIIVTCSTGREATLQYIVLKHLLNYPNVRVYEGSWTEYSAQPDLPVETGRDAA